MAQPTPVETAVPVLASAARPRRAAPARRRKMAVGSARTAGGAADRNRKSSVVTSARRSAGRALDAAVPAAAAEAVRAAPPRVDRRADRSPTGLRVDPRSAPATPGGRQARRPAAENAGRAGPRARGHEPMEAAGLCGLADRLSGPAMRADRDPPSRPDLARPMPKATEAADLASAARSSSRPPAAENAASRTERKRRARPDQTDRNRRSIRRARSTPTRRSQSKYEFR